MKKEKKISFLGILVLLSSLSFSSSGFASEPEISKEDGVKVFYEKYVKDSDGIPLNTSPQTNSLVKKAANIERTTTATVYDENGNIVDEVTFEKNVNENLKANTAAITGKSCTVLIAVDEEFRTRHSNWQALTAEYVENADDAFNYQFSIDLSVVAYRYWFSSGNNASEILNNLVDSGTDNYDFVIGFTAEPDFTVDGGIVGGIAKQYAAAPLYAGYSVVWDQVNNDSANWHATQHEISHNYGLDHDPKASTPICIMNYGTMYNTTTWHTEHKNLLASHVSWYGTNVNSF